MAWRELRNLLTRPRAEVSKVGVLLRDLDLVAPSLQDQVADFLGVADNVLWFASTSDHRKLSPKLKLPFLLYLGLSQAGRMCFLSQDGQQLLIDKGSLS